MKAIAASRNFLLAFLLLIASPLQANSAKVAEWAQQVLLATFSVNYTFTPDDFEPVKIYYSEGAWSGLSTFLGGYMTEVRSKKLTLHPQLTGNPRLVEEGHATIKPFVEDIPFWRIEQIVTIPELSLRIDFSLLVIFDEAQQKYRIQSLNMDLH